MRTVSAPSDEPVFFIAPDGHGEPTIWRHVPGGDPIACLHRFTCDELLWEYLARFIATRGGTS